MVNDCFFQISTLARRWPAHSKGAICHVKHAWGPSELRKLRARCVCRPVRLNFTRFATEQNFDWVYILQLDRNGSQNVLQKVSGSSSQVSYYLLVVIRLCSQSLPDRLQRLIK